MIICRAVKTLAPVEDNRILMAPDVVFQIPQPCPVIPHDRFGLLAVREGDQIVVAGLVKSDDAGKTGYFGGIDGARFKQKVTRE